MSTNESYSITHIWERFNPCWIKSGVLAGLAAGLTVLILASIAGYKTTGDWFFVSKLMGAGFFQGGATQVGGLRESGVVGLLIHFFLSASFGVAFAQLVDENSKRGSLIILGIVCGLVIWVFSGMLFLPAMNIFLAIKFSKILSLVLHAVFGASFGFYLGCFRKNTCS